MRLKRSPISLERRTVANWSGSLFQNEAYAILFEGYFCVLFERIIRQVGRHKNDRLFTPERHEDGVEDGARVIEEVGNLLVEADVVQLPVIAVVAQRAHIDVFTLQFEFTLSSLIHH